MDGIEFELGKTIQEEYDETQFDEETSEILFFLEDKVINNETSLKETEFYEDYKCFNTLDYESEIYQELLKEIRGLYESKY